jgi:hypothetical protein
MYQEIDTTNITTEEMAVFSPELRTIHVENYEDGRECHIRLLSKDVFNKLNHGHQDFYGESLESIVVVSNSRVSEFSGQEKEKSIFCIDDFLTYEQIGKKLFEAFKTHGEELNKGYMEVYVTVEEGNSRFCLNSMFYSAIVSTVAE